mmetsp:Transcript_12582/g.14195  ORF Transcript_12582/g.14195 Transcript_12582/m.14195 type:complete len:253 (-) Transcript_12582:128-886(-)|eukprot:CAMPEP_0170813374 /NCGR_PEP_ID=MMETSP0733-20121128/36816_1 /TAXON_ID=186038 /ORGANISM="Fragilariopsis kerguelensis, Strain L26-C5" /LENGTH=252 /DNA_ID=CAMNT_0011170711 /DNA_START=69 /DNA_END=827 /DNA_ORIENTATION=-
MIAARTFLSFLYISSVSAWTSSTNPNPTTTLSSLSSRRLFLDQTVAQVIVAVPSLVVLSSPAFADDNESAVAPVPSETPPAPVAVAIEEQVTATATAEVTDVVTTPPPPATTVVETEPVQVAAVVEEVAAVTPPPTGSATDTSNNDDSDFIKRLKAQSDAHADEYKKDSQRSDKLSVQQFRDQYKRPSYVGIRTPEDPRDSSKSTMVLQTELDQLLAQGKVIKTYASKITNKKTGVITDDYSQPIFVFVSQK